MKRKQLSLLGFIFILTLMLCVQTTHAASFKTASNHHIYKSIIGVPVIKIGVKGDYKVSHNKIIGWSNARCDNATYYPGWSCSKKHAKWAYKTAKFSKLRNNSHFYYGLHTQWIKIHIQSYDLEINKDVRP